jgi:hypothetical protein
VGIRGLVATGLIAAIAPVTAGVAVATATGAPPSRNIIQSPAPGGVSPLVIGGHNARSSSWPYLASVISPEGLCTGELVGARWVLTARHCVTSASGAVFAAGGMRIAIGVGPLLSRRSWLTPVRIVSFPGYRPSTSIGDLALIQLAAPTTRQAVELATVSPDPTASLPARIAGWGLTSDNATTTPNVPKDALTMIWPQTFCAQTEPSVFDPATEICAGGPDPSGTRQYPSVCNGDSGGPLVLPGSGGAWTDRLVGITDFGSDAGCDAAPNAFQSVPAHLRWITRTAGLGPVPIVRARQTAAGHSNAVITVFLRPSQARTTILVIGPNGSPVAARRAQAWHRQPVRVTLTGLVPGLTVRGYRVVTTNAYGTSSAVGVVVATRPVPCVLTARGACPARNLSGRNLSGRNLTAIDLRATVLANAQLVGTNLTRARLTGANLTNANLTGAILAGAKLSGVVWSNTTCPDGSDSSTNATAPPSCIGH